MFGRTTDDGDVIAFESVREAESHAEPWDVNDGLWQFWDSTGRVLAAPGPVDEKARTALVPTSRIDADGLRSVLVGRLQRSEEPLDTSDTSLAELCRLAMTRLAE